MKDFKRVIAVITIFAMSFAFCTVSFSELSYQEIVDEIFTELRKDPDFLPALYAVQPNYQNGYDNDITVEDVNNKISEIISEVVVRAVDEKDTGRLTKDNIKDRLEAITDGTARSMLEGLMFVLFSDAFPGDMEELRDSFRPLGHSILKVAEGFLFSEEDPPTPDSGSSGNISGGTTRPTPTPTPIPQADETPSPTETESPVKVSFTDLDNHQWAAEAVETLSGMEVINGYGNGIFAPGDNVTREQFVKMLVILFDIQSTGDEAVDFDDISEDEWYYPFVVTMSRVGIVKGLSDTSFGTGQDISRQDMAVMLYRIYESKGYDMMSEVVQHIFKDDAQIAEYARESVLTFKQMSIINGTPDNYFFPQSRATRAEAAQILYNCIK